MSAAAGAGADAGVGTGMGGGAGAGTGANAGIGAGVDAGAGSADGAGATACRLGSRCRPSNRARATNSTATPAVAAQTTTRDRLRAGTVAGFSGGAVGADTAIAGNETGDCIVAPWTTDNPTCERSGVTARPAKGISASIRSATEA